MTQMQVIAIVVIVVLAGHMAVSLLQRQCFTRLQKALLDTESDRFERMMHSTLTTLFLPPYTTRMLLLQRADLKNDDAAQEQILDDLGHRRLNESQQAEVAMRGFNYYLMKKNRDQCAAYKEKISRLSGHDEMKKYAQRAYDIVLLGKDTHLDELLSEYAVLPEEMKSGCEYLIAQSYANRNDKTNAQRYNALSRQHLRNMTNSL